MIDGATECQALYRLLPSVDAILLRPEFHALLRMHSRPVLIESIRRVLSQTRLEIATGMHTPNSLANHLVELAATVEGEAGHAVSPTLVPVLNATGVILHTNLGRAPLSAEAVRALAAVAGGYSNLEFDLANGNRGRRDQHAEPMLLRVLRSLAKGTAEQTVEGWAVAIVNNCAAATFLALNSLAQGGEVLVSRGELVEIGGGFRIPEILSKAGVILREVGTTNRTRLADYEGAINANTRMILRVHQANFSMEGFTQKPKLADVVDLGRRTGVTVFDDQGTGLLLGLDDLGIRGEPSLINSFHAAPDLIATSGDKLLGGPQCGLLVGKVELIEAIRANPLFRALRVDKLTYAALEATLISYAAGRETEIPTIRMLRIPSEVLRIRCEAMRDALHASLLEASVVSTASVIGGGTAPGATLASFALSLRHSSHTALNLLANLRRQTPPVIARVQNDCVLLDLRTIPPEQDGVLIGVLQAVAGGEAE